MGSSNGVVIALCRADDVARITECEPSGQGYARATFAAQEAGRCVYLVAWLDGEPVGSGELEWAEIPELKNLQVRPSHRGKGIGTAILDAAETAGRDSGTICLGVGTDNPDARRLYERLGYRATGRRETYTYEYVDADGVRRSATENSEYLQKDLNAPV